MAAEAQPEGSPTFPPGDYRIEEELPSTPRGDWRLSSVFCNTTEKDIIDGTAVHFTVPKSGGVCTFTNTFTPAGSITLHKSTVGATGTFQFAIRPQFGEVREFIQRATTTSDSAEDRERATGDATNHIPLGVYTIQETTASSEGDDGLWRVDSVICDGSPKQSFEGGIRLELTAANPDRDCTWTNQLIKSPNPPEPPQPTPPPTPTPLPTPVPQPPVSPPSGAVAGETAVSPPAELRITKVVKPRRITLGHSARWTVTVRNLGPVDARAVTLVERSRVGRANLKLHPSRGRCRGKPPRFCVIGRLKPGQRATVTVTARPRRLGRIHNVVVVNSITRQRTTRGKRASATAVVVPAAAPRFTG